MIEVANDRKKEMIHPRSEQIGDAYPCELVAYLILHTVGN